MLKKYFNWSIIACLLGLWLVVWGSLSGKPINLVIFLILVGIGLLLAIHKTRQTFWLLLALVPIETVFLSPVQLPFDLRAYQLLGFFLAAILIHRWFGKKENRSLFNLRKYILGKNEPLKNKIGRMNLLDRLLILFVVFSFFGAWWNAPEREVSIKLSIILASFAVVYFLVKKFLKKSNHQLEAVWFFLLGAKVVFLFGLYQTLAQRFDWESFAVMDGRINSVFAEPDWLGIYLVLIIALLLWGKLSVGHFGESLNICKTDFQKLIDWLINGSLFLGMFSVILTVSRSAWVAVAILMAIFSFLLFFMIKRNNIFNFKKNLLGKEVFTLVFMIILAVLIVDFFSLSTFHLFNRAESSISGKQKITVSCTGNQKPPIEIESIQTLKKIDCRHIDLEEITSEKKLGNSIYEIYRPDPNVQIRKEIYAKTWDAVKEHPIIGQGFGSSAVILGQDQRGEGLNASNIFLEVLLSTGLIGLAWFVIIIFTPFFAAIKKYSQEKNTTALRKRNFIILTTIAIIIPNLFNAGLLLGFFWVWLAAVSKLKEDIS